MSRMAEQYTPTTEEVREGYSRNFRDPNWADDAFGRWLAEHDRQVSEKAYRSGRLDEHHDCKRYAEYEEGKLTAEQLKNNLRSRNPYRKEQDNE